jgi:ATP-dependent Clp protease adaptor protein ClpS
MSPRAAPCRSSTMPAEAEPEVLPDEPDTDELGETELEESVGTDRPWIVIVWNDPVNLQSYVVYVFQKLFGYSRAKAKRLMLQVHHEGRAVVSDGTREKCEADVSRLHAHGLWATMEHPA